MSTDIRPPAPPYFTLPQASEAFQVPLGELRHALKSGQLRLQLVPVRDHRLTGADIDAWLRARTDRSAAAADYVRRESPELTRVVGKYVDDGGR